MINENESEAPKSENPEAPPAPEQKLAAPKAKKPKPKKAPKPKSVKKKASAKSKPKAKPKMKAAKGKKKSKKAPKKAPKRSKKPAKKAAHVLRTKAVFIRVKPANNNWALTRAKQLAKKQGRVYSVAEYVDNLIEKERRAHPANA